MSVDPVCGKSTITRGVVVFEVGAFLAAFPQFSTVPAGALQFNFTQATLQLDNSCRSKVQDAVLREQLLWLLTAHITRLLNGENGKAAAALVGRISDATEGSVSVTAEMPGATTLDEAYYLQTQYGATYWRATARFRTMQYVRATNTPRYGRPPGLGGPYGNGSGGSFGSGGDGIY